MPRLGRPSVYTAGATLFSTEGDFCPFQLLVSNLWKVLTPLHVCRLCGNQWTACFLRIPYCSPRIQTWRRCGPLEVLKRPDGMVTLR